MSVHTDGKGYFSKEGMCVFELGTSVLSFGSTVHELTQAVGRIDSTIKLGLKPLNVSLENEFGPMLGVLAMTTFNHLKS